MPFDYLVVGCGYAGSVISERIASQLGRKVLLIDKRTHVGGNAYDFKDEYGLLVHKYGPHVFHTNSKKIWDYLSTFTDWMPYEHRVLAEVNGIRVPVPFNLNSLHMLFNEKEARYLEKLLLQTYSFGQNISILSLRNSNVPEIRKLAEFIYRTIFLGYTLKQWELTPEMLDPSVTGRVPVRLSHDDRYFQDKYQAMPKHGYTELFRRMLDNEQIEVRLNTEYSEVRKTDQFKEIIYTGPVDAFFDYKYGRLPYRSLTFEFIHHEIQKYQEVAQINFPDKRDYTRITEFKHITQQDTLDTTIAMEFPTKYIEDINEPYYPIPVESSRLIYTNYRKEVEKLKGRVTFVGRLAEYRYFNMDQIVGRALSAFKNEIASRLTD